MKRDLARRTRSAGIAGLVCSLVFYILGVDGAWYRVDGMVRVMAETHGLLRWRLIAHLLGLSNGGMRAQSWTFIAFPILFWMSMVSFLVGTLLIRRKTRGWTRQQHALARLQTRRAATQVERERRLALVTRLAALGAGFGIISMLVFHSAPKTNDVVSAQTIAGAWRLHVEEIRDDQRLLVFMDESGDGRFGDIVSVSRAESIVREDNRQWAAEEARAQYECQDSRCGEQAAVRRVLRRKAQALSKEEAEGRAAQATAEWRSQLSLLNQATIAGVVLGLLFTGLLLVAMPLT